MQSYLFFTEFLNRSFIFIFLIYLLPLLRLLNHTAIVTFIIIFQLCDAQPHLKTFKTLRCTLLYIQEFFILCNGIHIPPCIQIFRRWSLYSRVESHFCQLTASNPHRSFFLLASVLSIRPLLRKKISNWQRWTLSMPIFVINAKKEASDPYLYFRSSQPRASNALLIALEPWEVPNGVHLVGGRWSSFILQPPAECILYLTHVLYGYRNDIQSALLLI